MFILFTKHILSFFLTIHLAYNYNYFLIEWYFFLIVISVAELPTDHVNEGIKFNGARAVTSESGKGAILQHNQRLYELTCENSGCSWRILPQELSPGVLNAVMMTLPSDYTC